MFPYMLFPLAGMVFVSVIAFVFSNVSLLLNSATAYQLAKQLSLPATAAMESLLFRKRFSPTCKAALCLVVAGVATATFRPSWFTFRHVHASAYGANVLQLRKQAAEGPPWWWNPGAISALVGAAAGAVAKVLTKHVLRESKGATATQLLNAYSPYCAACVLLVSPLFDGGIMGQLEALHLVTTDPRVALTLVATFPLAVGVNLSVVKLVEASSATTYQVVGHVKTVCVFVWSVLVFHDRFSALRGLGIAATLAGTVLYSASNLRRAGRASGGAGGAGGAGGGGGLAEPLLINKAVEKVRRLADLESPRVNEKLNEQQARRNAQKKKKKKKGKLGSSNSFGDLVKQFFSPPASPRPAAVRKSGSYSDFSQFSAGGRFAVGPPSTAAASFASSSSSSRAEHRGARGHRRSFSDEVSPRSQLKKVFGAEGDGGGSPGSPGGAREGKEHRRVKSDVSPRNAARKEFWSSKREKVV